LNPDGEGIRGKRPSDQIARESRPNESQPVGGSSKGTIEERWVPVGKSKRTKRIPGGQKRGGGREGDLGAWSMSGLCDGGGRGGGGRGGESEYGVGGMKGEGGVFPG